MLKYQQKRNLKGELPASKLVPFLPTFSPGHPTVDSLVYRWFDQQGDYLGWTDSEEGKKYLLGKLYYKTKGAYRVNTKRSWNNRTTKMIRVYEKDSSLLALYGSLRYIKEADLIDIDDKKALLKITRAAVEGFTPTTWNILDYPNPYKVIPVEFREKLATDVANFIKSKHLEILQHIDDQMVSIDKAAAIDVSNTNATKGEWDFGGLSS